MQKLRKIYKRLFWILFNLLKPKRDFTLVRFENFYSIFKIYEHTAPKCSLFNLKELPFNKRRYELLGMQIGTEPSEAYFLIKAIHESLSIDGVCCEFGVAQGQTSALIANELLAFSKKKLYLFDSFEGLPEPTKEDILIDDIFNYGNILNYKGCMKSPKESLIKNLSNVGINKSKYKIFSGFVDKNFSNTSDLPEKVSFAYVDFDFYEPIKIILEFLLNVTDKGSFIIVDDYDFFSSGVKLAVDNFTSQHSEKFDYFVAPKYIGNFIVIKRIK
tara:strand:- start:1690 stop:2508 length:819 start_codon:yes stop_codon:yes gene_type:complete